MNFRNFINQFNMKQIVPFLRNNMLAFMLVLCLAYMLKHYYSIASPDDLKWLTTPLSLLIHYLTGITFTYETGYGYVNLKHAIGIEKGCVGINYMIAIFAMLTFSFIPRFMRQTHKLYLIASCAFLSCLCTLIVNALRISTAIALPQTAPFDLSYEQFHRLQGIAMYFGAMCLLYFISARIVAKLTPSNSHYLPITHIHPPSRNSLIATPLLWYLAISILVPLLNGALSANPAQFLEHTAWILFMTGTGIYMFTKL